MWRSRPCRNRDGDIRFCRSNCPPTSFDAPSESPTQLGLVVGPNRVDRIDDGIAFPVDAGTKTGDRARGHDSADRQAAGGIDQCTGGDDGAEAGAQRCEPFQFLAVLEIGGDGGISDIPTRAGLQIAPGQTEVSFARWSEYWRSDSMLARQRPAVQL